MDKCEGKRIRIKDHQRKVELVHELSLALKYARDEATDATQKEREKEGSRSRRRKGECQIVMHYKLHATKMVRTKETTGAEILEKANGRT